MQLTFKISGLLLLALAACSHYDPATPAQPEQPPVQRASGIRDMKPLVDHHTHLISPLTADLINGPPLDQVEVPAPVADLLTRRARLWNDPSALSALFTDDALVLVDSPPKSGLFRGKTVAARFLSGRFARAYQLTPAAFMSSGNLAHVSGYYTRGEFPNLNRIGRFQLLLRKSTGGEWKIGSEAPSFPSEPPQTPVVAEQLIAALDDAGIHKAVVLSGAVVVGGRWLDIYHGTRTVAERHRMVRADNDWAAAQVARFLDRLLSFCSLNPLEPYALDELRRCASTGHRGMKLHFDESGIDLARPEHVAKARSLFTTANELRLPIVVHVGNNEGTPEEAAGLATVFLEQIAAAAPGITIQIAHLWGGSGYSEGALRAYAEAVSSNRASTRNLWFDMAEAPLIAGQYQGKRDQILADVAARIRQIGVGRVLFGSDTGGKGHLSPAEAWAQFRKDVPLREDELEAIARNVAPYAR